MKLLTSKKMKLQKVENKDKNYACSIAILKTDGKRLDVLNYRNAIYTIEDDVATDVLLEKKPQYKVCIGLNAIRKAYEEGQITNNEKFCYSAYDANDMFPSLKNMKTDDDKREFLKNYNRRNKTALYWSFLDKDEVKEVDEIVEENERIYPRSIY